MVPPLHAPAEQPHVPSLPHLWPQVPQLPASVCVLTSQALAPCLSQSAWPAGQETHIPFEQYWLAAHWMLQAPQLFPSLAVFVSQPSLAVLLQSAVPVGHAVTHVPLPQIFPAAQALAQEPQC